LANCPAICLAATFSERLVYYGVALGVALIVSIDIANGSALRSFGLFTESIAGHTTHQIVGGPEGLGDSVYRHLKVDLGVQAAAPTVSAYVRVLELDDQPLQLFGVDPLPKGHFAAIWESGELAEPPTLTPVLPP